MSTTTLERNEVATIAPAVALTPSEQDSLIHLAASVEKTERVRKVGPSSSSARAWSLGGNVD